MHSRKFGQLWVSPKSRSRLTERDKKMRRSNIEQRHLGNLDKLDNVKKLCRGDVRRRAMHYSLLLGGQGWRSSVIGRSICVQDNS